MNVLLLLHAASIRGPVIMDVLDLVPVLLFVRSMQSM